MKKAFRYQMAFRDVVIAEEDGAITDICFQMGELDGARVEQTSLIREAAAQLAAYFSGGRAAFDLPIAPKGTEFQQKTWNALLEIPYGETRSYGEIARRIGNPKASRAVGGANNRNPIAIVIPCHRVIGANGALVGYAGGLGVKESLLALEKKYKTRAERGRIE